MPYQNNTVQKDIVRKKWVEYSKNLYDGCNDKNKFTLLTLTTPQIEDILLFAKNGLFSLTLTETGAYFLTSGKVFCCEKNTPRFLGIREKLVGAKVEEIDICEYIWNSGLSRKSFPVDIINLDFDGCLSKLKKDPERLIDTVYNRQKEFGKNFSFFLTFPVCDDIATDAYVKHHKTRISSMLEENSEYNSIFTEKFNSINQIDFESVLTLSLSCFFARSANHFGFSLENCDFFVYGQKRASANIERKRMISLLFQNKYVSNTRSLNYFNSEVLQTLKPAIDLN